MKTAIKIISVILIITCISCVFVACSGGGLKGKWYDEKTGKLVLTLNSNGKGEMLGSQGTYKVSNSYITFTLNSGTALKIKYEKTGNKMETTTYLEGKNIGSLTLKRK